MNINIAFQIFKMTEPRNEDAFQEATAQYLDALMANGYLAWYHPAPNVYRRGLTGLGVYGKIPAYVKEQMKKTAIRLGAKGKRHGVKAGVFDIVIYSHRIAIELKHARNKLSADQIIWKAEAESWGWRCHTAYNPVEFLSLLVLHGFDVKGKRVKQPRKAGGQQ